MPKTIYFVLPSLDAGGAEKIVATLCNNLDGDLFKPVLVLFEKKGTYLDYLNPNVEIIELEVKRIRYAPFKLIPLLIKNAPDAVFAGWGEIAAYLGPFRFLFPKTKFIARETNVISKHVTRKSIRFLYQFLNNFDHIIAQSDDMQHDLERVLGIEKNKITKINNPVDFDFIQNKLREGNNFTFADQSKKQLVAVGNVSYRKGFDNLIKMFAHLPKAKYQLNIIGSGPDMQAFKNLAVELNCSENITFWGQQSNAIKFLAVADLFILSSRYEGFPNVLLEAGACGTFAIANDCPGGINEIITNQNGRIFSIEKHKEFAAVVAKEVEQHRNEEEVVNSIKNRFELSKIMGAYNRLLSEII